MRVFVNSLPKSGTHLLLKCLELFGHNSCGHIGSGLFLGLSITAQLRRYLFRPIRQGFIVGIDTPIEVPKMWVLQHFRKLRERDFLTGHIGYTNDLFYALNDFDIKPIVVIRDPRAVMNSFIHFIVDRKSHFLHSEFKKLSKKEKATATLYGRNFKNGVLQPLKIRCQALEPWLNVPNALVVRFEDLIGESGGGSTDLQRETLIRIAQFIDASLEDVPIVAEKLFGPGKATFRKGTIDSWREELPPEMLQEIENELSDILSAWGYSGH